MKSLAAFALAVLSCVPAMAQFGGLGTVDGPERPRKMTGIDAEILEMEQEADKEVLKEALLLQARLGMKPAPEKESEQKRHAAEIATLRDFIAQKKEAIKARAAESKARVPKVTAGGLPPKPDRKETIEKNANAQVEVQFLQAKLGLLREPLAKAIGDLAEAELTADADGKGREDRDKARKEYDKIKAMYVEQYTQLELVQQAGGFGGGMR